MKSGHLALFLPDMGGGGAERVALALLQGFLDRGYSADLVLINQRGALLPLVPAEVEIINLKAPKIRQVVLPLARYLRRRRPRALHAMMWPLPLVAIAARDIAKTDTRIVASEHTTLSNMPHALQHRAVRVTTRFFYKRLNGLAAVSAGVADDLTSFIGVPRDQIAVIHNPLLLPSTLPTPAVGRWPGGTRRILAMGSLKPEKDFSLLLRALKRVRATSAPSLLILGDGPLRAELEKEVGALALTDAVMFAGFQLDPWPFLAAADLFVLSSTSEGLPTVLIEALHAGVPIVSTDCLSGPREILGEGAYGTLIPPGNEEALAEAISKQLDLRISSNSSSLGRARAKALAGSNALASHLALMTDGS